MMPKHPINTKRTIKSIRRDELVNAAISVIGENGLANTTMATIANRAGMSTALVTHYFESKDQLLALTMRNLSNLFRQEIMAMAPPNATPAQRLRAIINGSFTPENLTMPKRKAWVQFMVNAMTDEKIFHLYALTGSRVVSNIRYAVKQLVKPDDVDDTVDGIAALIDGFFWENAVSCTEDDLIRARRICWNYATLLIPSLRSVSA
jgi:TetR/AcrR family transcriptional regulator, transcriptional repressor of bet genes